MLPTLTPRRQQYEYPTLRREMEDFFDRLWGGREGTPTGYSYPVDIKEEDGKFVVEAEMPGFKKEDIDISIDQGALNISAERKEEPSKGRKRLSERRFTHVERSFTLPQSIDEEKIEASLSDGVLRLEIPKNETASSKQINIR